MIVEHLTHMLQTDDMFVRECVKDITHEESLVRPQSVGNSFNWVLGHIVVYRDALLELLGKARLHPEAERAQFKRNAHPTTGMNSNVALETLVADFERAGAQLQEAVAGATAAQLAAAFNDKYSVEHRLVHLIWHEAYHVGQLGMLRRLAGKEPVV